MAEAQATVDSTTAADARRQGRLYSIRNDPPLPEAPAAPDTQVTSDADVISDASSEPGASSEPEVHPHVDTALQPHAHRASNTRLCPSESIAPEVAVSFTYRTPS